MNGRSTFPAGCAYIDAHCHVDLAPDPVKAMTSAREQGIGVLAVTNTPSVYSRMRQLAEPFDNVVCALGLHPELVPERMSELRLFRRHATETRFIGEIGLDGTNPRNNPLVRQQECLRAILASSRRKIVTVHSRKAVAPLLETIAPDFTGTVILHWFTGTAAQAQAAIARGWFFSVNLAITHSASGRRLLELVPREQVLTESDAPLLRHGDRPGQSADVIAVTSDLARLWKLDDPTAGQLILRNYERLLVDH